MKKKKRKKERRQKSIQELIFYFGSISLMKNFVLRVLIILTLYCSVIQYSYLLKAAEKEKNISYYSYTIVCCVFLMLFLCFLGRDFVVVLLCGGFCKNKYVVVGDVFVF